MPNSITHYHHLPSTQEEGLLVISEILDSFFFFFGVDGKDAGVGRGAGDW